MRILFVSSELTPTASTGELGEAVGALVRSLARRGHDVVAIVPAYADHPVPSDAKDLGSLGDIPTFAGPRAMRATFSEDEETSLRIVRLHCPTLYGRPGIYGAPDDFEDNPDRFWALAVGAVGALARLEWAPEIAHSHDWHAGWLPALLRSQSALQTVRTVHTCYDLQMVGLAPMAWATELGIVPELLTPEGIEYFGQLSFAKVGLRFADVAVMSTPEGSDPVDGLAGVVRARGATVARIPRALDVMLHNPAQDLGLPARFGADDLSGKSLCKRRLQAAMGLEVNPSAVIIVVSKDVPSVHFDGVADPQVQWLPVDGLSGGMLRLAFAGADAVMELGNDPWSTLMRTAERYGLATIVLNGPDAPEDAYVFEPEHTGALATAVTRLVTDYSDAQRWNEAIAARLRREPERGVARYEMLYRQTLSHSAGPPIPWAQAALLEQLAAVGQGGR